MPVCGRLFERKEMLANIKQPLFPTTQQRQNNHYYCGVTSPSGRVMHLEHPEFSFGTKLQKMASKCRSCMMLYVYMCILSVSWCVSTWALKAISLALKWTILKGLGSILWDMPHMCLHKSCVSISEKKCPSAQSSELRSTNTWQLWPLPLE